MAPAPDHCQCPDRFHRILDVGRFPERQLLHQPLPLAVLLAVPRHPVRLRPGRLELSPIRRWSASFGPWWIISPAIIVLVVPLGFRLTCYYYRKAYYRSLLLSPPACAVREPRRRYTGETRFPLIMQNVHRWFFYLGSCSTGS